MSTEANYLQNLKEKKIKSKVFLSNGTMLSGLITNFDEFSIILDQCLVYKDKVISISPF